MIRTSLAMEEDKKRKIKLEKEINKIKFINIFQSYLFLKEHKVVIIK